MQDFAANCATLLQKIITYSVIERFSQHFILRVDDMDRVAAALFLTSKQFFAAD